jgi:hypothetical protein
MHKSPLFIFSAQMCLAFILKKYILVQGLIRFSSTTCPETSLVLRDFRAASFLIFSALLTLLTFFLWLDFRFFNRKPLSFFKSISLSRAIWSFESHSSFRISPHIFIHQCGNIKLESLSVFFPPSVGYLLMRGSDQIP